MHRTNIALAAKMPEVILTEYGLFDHLNFKCCSTPQDISDDNPSHVSMNTL